MIEVQLTAVALVMEVLGGRSLSTALGSAKTLTCANTGGAELSGSAGLSSSDWGAIQDIAYGVFRQLRFLRAVLTQLISKPVTDDDVEALLLVSLYQLESTRAAPHAVVNDAVEACVRLRKTSAKGLVNAVLRAFLRRRDEVLAGAGKIAAVRLSYPDWWIDALKHAYPDCYCEILVAGNAHPPMTLRVNRRLIARDAYQAMLRDTGIASEAASQS
ncbi:MAG: transcription antitermination factor NusB, partial [Betaproteobacteria bacterium]